MKNSLFIILFIVGVATVFQSCHTSSADGRDTDFKVWGDTINQYIEKNMYSEALHDMTEYSLLAHKADNRYAMAMSYHFAGRISDVLNDHSQAKLLYQEAIENFLGEGFKQEAGLVYRNLALLYLHEFQLDSAFHYIQKCDELADQPRMKCSVYAIYGLIYYDRSDILGVRQFEELADEQRQKLDSLHADEYYYLKSLCCSNEELSANSKDFEKALLYADSINNEDWKNQRVSNIYREMGDFEKAYFTMRQNYDHKRRTISYRLIDTYSEFKAHNDNFHLKERNAGILSQMLLIIVTGVLLIAATGILLYLRNRNRYARILEQERESAQRAVEQKTALLHNIRNDVRQSIDEMTYLNKRLIDDTENNVLSEEEQLQLVGKMDAEVQKLHGIFDNLISIPQTAKMLVFLCALAIPMLLPAAKQDYRSDFRTWEDSIYRMIDQYRFEQAFQELELFHGKANETKDNLGIFLYYRLNGDIYRVMDDFPNAVTNYKLSLQGDMQGVDSLTRATSYRRAAYCYLQFENNSLDSLRYFGRRCVELSPTPRMKRIIGAMEGMYFLKRLKDPGRAREMARKVMQIQGAEKIYEWDFDDYYYLISFYYEESDPAKALTYADSISVAMTRNKKLQYLYVKQKDYVNALRCLELSIKDENEFRMDRLSSLVSTHISLAGNKRLEQENELLESAGQYLPTVIVFFAFLVFFGFMYVHIRTRNHYVRQVARQREMTVNSNLVKDAVIKNLRASTLRQLDELIVINHRAAKIGHSSLTHEQKKEIAEDMAIQMNILAKQIDNILELTEHEV